MSNKSGADQTSNPGDRRQPSHAPWVLDRKLDTIPWLFDLHVGQTFISGVELCTDLMSSAPNELVLITNPAIEPHLDKDTQAIIRNVRARISSYEHTRRLGNTGAVKSLAIEILDAGADAGVMTVAEGRYGPIPTVRIPEEIEGGLIPVFYPGPRETPPEGVRGNNQRPFFEAVARVFHKLMPCYLEKAVAYLETVYFAAYRPQGVHYATELRQFVGQRIDTKINPLIAAEADNPTGDTIAKLIAGYRDVSAPRDRGVAAFCREIYASNRVQLYELELARELMMLLANGLYRVNRLPHKYTAYEDRVGQLVRALSARPDTTTTCGRLIAAFDALRDEPEFDDADRPRAPEWAQRLDRVARHARTISRVDSALRDAPVRLAYTYERGTRDAEEFTAKLRAFVREPIGEDNLFVFPEEEGGQPANEVALAGLYFVDGILLYNPSRHADSESSENAGIWKVIEPLVHANRLEKRIVIVGETGSDCSRLVDAVSYVPARVELCLPRDTIESFARKLENLCHRSLVWRNPAPAFDDDFQLDLLRCFTEMRAHRAIDQIHCYRVYFSNDEWQVFRAVYEASRGSQVGSRTGNPADGWVDAENVYRTRFASGTDRKRADMSLARFNRVIDDMSRQQFGMWGRRAVVCLIQRHNEHANLVRDNVDKVLAENWGDPSPPASLVKAAITLLTKKDSEISRTPSDLKLHAIHRITFAVDQEPDLFTREQSKKWARVMRDETTQLRRKEARKQELTSLVLAARNDGSITCVVSLDIDHFKNVNDTFGHPVGDHVLAEVAGVVRQACAKRYEGYREGGEEFVVLMPNATEEEGVALAERIRRDVRSLHQSAGRGVTISAGVYAFRPDDLIEGEQAMEVVDKALYAAKNGGRDRVVGFSMLAGEG